MNKTKVSITHTLAKVCFSAKSLQSCESEAVVTSVCLHGSLLWLAAELYMNINRIFYPHCLCRNINMKSTRIWSKFLISSCSQLKKIENVKQCHSGVSPPDTSLMAFIELIHHSEWVLL